MRELQERRGEPERVRHTNITDKPKVRLSDRELADLMGTNRDTYTRRRGAVRKR